VNCLGIFRFINYGLCELYYFFCELWCDPMVAYGKFYKCFEGFLGFCFLIFIYKYLYYILYILYYILLIIVYCNDYIRIDVLF